ncbi:histidine kinase [Chitinophagaceae bacterium MMS25-I14]
METNIYPGRSLRAYLFIFLTLFAGLATGQECNYVHYDVRDGLPSSNVHGITQDKDGFIWFATESGLCRFDGIHFKVFTTNDGLPSNEVLGIWPDSKDRLWIITFGSSACYYYKGRFHNQQNDTLLRKIKLKEDINGYAEDTAGNILISYRDYGGCFLFRDGSLRQVSDLSHFDTAAFFRYRSFEGAQMFASYVRLPGKMFRYTKDRSVLAVQFGLVAMYEHSATEQNYLVGTSSGVFMLVFPYNQQDGHKIKIKSPSLRNTACMLNDSIACLWNKQSAGVHFYDIYHRKYVGWYLHNLGVHYIYQDRERNIWFSTGTGVFKLMPSRVHLINFGTENNLLAVNDIHKINNSLILGCDAEQSYKLDFFADSTTGVEGRCHTVRIASDMTRYEKKHAVTMVSLSSSDFLSIGARISSLYETTWSRHALKTAALFNDTVLVASSDETFLTSRHQHFYKKLHTGRSTCAYPYRGSYYIGTLRGLYVIHPGKPEVFLGDSNALLKNQISSLSEDTSGALWVGTNQRGIVGYKNGKVIANITFETDGLTSNLIRCLYTSGSTLWVGTDKGLNKVDISGKPVVTARFNTSDGLNSENINTIFVDNHMVYLGTPQGLCYFDEHKVPQHSISLIHLTDIISSGNHFMEDTGHVVLAHKDNNIRFEYSGISFLSGGNITYRYRLLGLNDQWQTTKENALSYPSLPSGKYMLQLEAINRLGDHSKMLEWHFEVEKLIWETWWFRVLITVVSAVIIWLFIQWRIRRVQGREAEKRLTTHKIIELEQMALRAQMNPHFIFNCLNSIQQYIMRHDAKGANRYLSRFAALVRQTLDHSSKMYVSLAEEVAFLDNYLELEKLQMNGSFEYSIHIDDGIDRSIQIPNMVIQPYIENAVKHAMGERGGGDRITLSFTENKAANKLVCIVEDNGIGINRSKEKQMQQHQSKGMSITQERVEMLNQLYADKKIITTVKDLSLSEPREMGTRVIIEFPL